MTLQAAGALAAVLPAVLPAATALAGALASAAHQAPCNTPSAGLAWARRRALRSPLPGRMPEGSGRLPV